MLIGVIAEESLLPLVITPSRFIDGDPFAAQFLLRADWIYQARSTIVGFVMPGLVDETDLVFGAENIFHSFVTNGYLGIFPNLYDDTVPEIFYSPTRSTQPILQPPPGIDTDFIYSATIPVNPPLAPRAVFVDTDVFYPPTFQAGLGPSLVVDSDIIRAQIIRRDGYDDLVLLAETFNDVDVFYVATAPREVSPGLVIDGDIIYAASQIASLLPGAFTSSDTFFTAFILSQLQPTRVVDSEFIFGPELRTPGRMGLFVDDDIFPVATVHFGPLLAPLVTEADVILSSFIGEMPPLGPLDSRIDFDDTFYVPVVSQNQALMPHLWIDVEIYLGVFSIILGQGMISPAFTDTDTFFAPTLPPTLSPALYSPADAFFVPTILNVTQPLAPSWIQETDTFFVPSIAALSSFDGTLSSGGGPIMPSTPAPTVIYLEG